MRKLAIVLIPLLLLALVVGAIGCGVGGRGPEDTLRGFYEAIEAKDAAKVASYFTEDVGAELMPYFEADFANYDKIKIADLKMSVVSETEDAATVEAEYDWETTAFGETNGGHQIETIELAKVDGKWLIAETPTLEIEKLRLITSVLIQLLHEMGGEVIIKGTSLTAFIGGEAYETTIPEWFNPFDEFETEISHGNVTVNYEAD